jgi:hypothetical protein
MVEKPIPFVIAGHEMATNGRQIAKMCQWYRPAVGFGQPGLSA